MHSDIISHLANGLKIKEVKTIERNKKIIMNDIIHVCIV